MPHTLPRLLVALVALTSVACGGAQPAGPAEPPHPLEIVLVNERDTPIFVLSANECAFEPVAMRTADGRHVQWSGQSHYCEDVRAGNCPSVGGCAGAGVRRVGPGERYTYAWDGNVLESQRVDDAPAGCPSDCVVSVGAAPGRYTLEASAFAACEGDCSCESTDGVCPRSESLDGAPTLRATADVAVAQDHRVELVFRP